MSETIQSFGQLQSAHESSLLVLQAVQRRYDGCIGELVDSEHSKPHTARGAAYGYTTQSSAQSGIYSLIYGCQHSLLSTRKRSSTRDVKQVKCKPKMIQYSSLHVGSSLIYESGWMHRSARTKRLTFHQISSDILSFYFVKCHFVSCHV